MTSDTKTEMDEAIAAGNGTLHGAIDYWQSRAINSEAECDALKADAERLMTIYLGVTSDGVSWRLPEWGVMGGNTPPRFDEFKAQIDAERKSIDEYMRNKGFTP